MLKKTIAYTDYNGNEQVDEFYFNLSKPELIELEVGQEESFSDYITRIVAAEKRSDIIATMKRIIGMSYGVKSGDGKRFMKSPEMLEEFKSTAAYEALFTELATDASAAAEFINGIIPGDLGKLSAKSDGEAKDETPRYVRENRPATQAEIRGMNKAELQAAMRFKNKLTLEQSQNASDDETERLRKQLLGEI